MIIKNILKEDEYAFTIFVYLYNICIFVYTYTLKEETFAEETFASRKIREIFRSNFREFRELADFGFFARINFRVFMI